MSGPDPGTPSTRAFLAAVLIAFAGPVGAFGLVIASSGEGWAYGGVAATGLLVGALTAAIAPGGVGCFASLVGMSLLGLAELAILGSLPEWSTGLGGAFMIIGLMVLMGIAATATSLGFGYWSVARWTLRDHVERAIRVTGMAACLALLCAIALVAVSAYMRP